MIFRQDPRYYPIVCALCGEGEFGHDRGAYGRCYALEPEEYERLGYHALRREDDAMRDAIWEKVR